MLLVKHLTFVQFYSMNVYKVDRSDTVRFMSKDSLEG